MELMNSVKIKSKNLNVFYGEKQALFDVNLDLILILFINSIFSQIFVLNILLKNSLQLKNLVASL